MVWTGSFRGAALAAIAGAMMIVPAQAQAMTVADFLKRADALKAKGMMAMFARDEIKLLTGEVQTAADAYRADIDKARARGDRSLGCPPPKGKAGINSDDLLKSFRAVPAERRDDLSVKSGFYEMMRNRFPCA